MISIPTVEPPLPIKNRWDRALTPADAYGWLVKGWQDFTTRPALSIAYGVLVFAVSIVIIAGLLRLSFDYILFPALAGFMVVGPVLAVGLYEKSRRLASGEPLGLMCMIFVKAKSGGQILFAGVMLCLLMVTWIRAAVIVYALFFGVVPFPGVNGIAAMLFSTPVGWAMLVIGSLIGGLFAALGFAISMFSIPMLLNERVDAFTAMGSSMALVWNNLPATLTWAAFCLAGCLLSLATGLLGLIVVFPVLGHGTWHAYRAVSGAAPPPG